MTSTYLSHISRVVCITFNQRSQRQIENYNRLNTYVHIKNYILFNFFFFKLSNIIENVFYTRNNAIGYTNVWQNRMRIKNLLFDSN